MKLGPFRLWEKFKGFWAKGGLGRRPRRKFHLGEHNWRERCEYFDRLYNDHPLAKMSALTIAGQVLANDIFLEPRHTEGSHKQRSKEAVEQCEELNENIKLPQLVYDTVVDKVKHGSSFWEKTDTPVFDVRRVPNQEGIEPYRLSDIGEIVEWKLVNFGSAVASWSADEIVHHAWNITSLSWPYGTSLYVGLDTEFAILAQLEYDLKEHMHKTAFPNEVIGVGDANYYPNPTQLSEISTDVRNWEPGERFVTSFPLSRIEAGTGGNRISDLHEVLMFCKEQIIDGIGIPPISKQWSSTMASAQEMMPWARANLIAPMQRLIGWKLEREVYRPYLESLGYSVKVCPRVKWEAPDAHKDEEAEYWAMQVQSGIVPAEYAALEQGFDLDKIAKMREEELVRQTEQQQLMKVQQQNQGLKENPEQQVNPKGGD